MFNTLHRLVNTVLHSPNASINTPLLDKVSIEKLRHLAEMPADRMPHYHEVEHRQYGDMRSVYRGYGLDYEESRPYQSGDEMRFMNWRLSARSNELYMKVFREERRPSVFILVDRRQSMRFGSKTRLKVTQAARISTYLAFLAKQQHAPIGGVVLNEATEWIPEANGEAGVYALLSKTNSPCPPINNEENELSLDHTLRLLLNMLVRGSVIYLISDFHDLDSAAHPVLLQLSEEHQVHAINVHDKLERTLPANTGINIVNPEANEDIYLGDRENIIQAQFQQRSDAHFESIRTSFSQFNIKYTEIDADLDDIERFIS